MKKNGFIMFFVMVIYFSIAAVSVFAQSDEGESIHTIIEKNINQAIDDGKVQGAVVSIVKDGKVIYCNGYGYADKENGIKADGENTAFRIGSVSKIFVSMAAVELAQNGQLDMNAPITEYIGEEFNTFKYPVTMNNLLTHTAGFEEIVDGFVVNSESELQTLEQFVKLYKPDQPFKPGEVTAYSNYGVGLAGYVIEKITGVPFDKYVQEKILLPLGMNNTTYTQPYKLLVTVSKAYDLNGNEKADSYLNAYPSGSMVSTALDMSKYMISLLGQNNIIDEAEKKMLFEQHFTMDESYPGIGYVWDRREQNGHLYYSKDGDTDHFTSYMGIYPEQQIGVFYTLNSPDQNLRDTIINEISKELYGEQVLLNETGEKNITDISGYYIPARSNFSNLEKMAYSLTSTIHVQGDSKTGFNIEGNKLIPVASDLFMLNGTYLKYSNINGHKFLSSSEGPSLLNIHWYESKEVQYIILLSFVICSVIGFILPIVSFISRKRKAKEIDRPLSISLATGVINLSTFVAVVFTIIKIMVVNNTMKANILIILSKLEVLVILACGAVIIALSTYLWRKRRNIALSMFYSIWSISYAVFIFWMNYVNII